ncbi:MFS transporter [Bacillus sonorensis]|uniref:Permease n=2 Tax=Bacillus sonorensis TaxID=119858 RepID=M5P7Z5_9BACI|nr:MULTISPECIES: MFS transporter [Bacillus]TWK74575.1 Purine efflux pump PbuE [Bacillus paralicheniformis]ASB87510.1 putative MFS-type transporter YceJ [Bacillus sonorensis]EME75544.1 permease [Bacillus sonorensis L12]MBG9913900.1 MFS transporter [Bacillus sonorensis]MCY7858500.1 MFS transporter [Bacillus sonorensis]
MKKVLPLFFGIMFMIGTDTFLISPLLPTLRELYGVPLEISGWLVSAYALGYALFALIAGPVSDGLNRKTVMTWGMAAFGTSTFLSGFAPDFWIMIFLRFAAGVSAAFVTPQVWASIPALVSKERMVKSMGIAAAGLSFSQMLGLPIGGYLASIHWSAPFLILGVCSFFFVWFIHLVLPDLKPSQKTAGNILIAARYKMLLSEPKVFKTFFAYFIFQTGNFAAFSFLGTWLADDFRLNVSQIGTAMLILGLGNVFGSTLGVHVAAKLGKAYSLYAGIAVLAVLYVILSQTTRISLFEAIFFVMFFMTGMIFTLMMSLLQSSAPQARGTIASLANSCMYIGQTAGASAAGLLYSQFGGFFAVALFTAVLYLFSMLLFKNSRILARSKPA